MMKKALNEKTYFELTEHNTLQIIVFAISAVVIFCLCCLITFPYIKDFFQHFLQGVVKTSGEPVPYSFASTEDLRQPSYLFSWAIDFDVKSTSPTRYWFNPLLSMSLVFSIFSVGVTALFTSLLPQKIGFMRQKIERETANLLDKLSLQKYGYYGKEEQLEISEEIAKADIRELHELASEYHLTLEDFKVLKKALLWLVSPLYMKILKIFDGIRVYMRFYFTTQYSNTVLGLVYIGAAFLIITIGLRGLKFIPPTQPSFILFGLGVEFSLLLVFAITTIFARQEEDHESDSESGGAGKSSGKSGALGSGFGGAKEVEQLLRVFIKSGGKSN
jgi:hypothetical protein